MCEALALLGMLPFLLGEVALLWAYGLWNWLSAWNLLDATTYGLQVGEGRSGWMAEWACGKGSGGGRGRVGAI